MLSNCHIGNLCLFYMNPKIITGHYILAINIGNCQQFHTIRLWLEIDFFLFALNLEKCTNPNWINSNCKTVHISQNNIRFELIINRLASKLLYTIYIVFLLSLSLSLPMDVCLCVFLCHNRKNSFSKHKLSHRINECKPKWCAPS